MKCITLTLNPAIDKHCFVKQFTLGYEHLSENEIFNAGGKGVNISRALMTNGIKSKAVVALGEENEASFCASLDEDNIDYTVIKTKGAIRENLTIHTESGGETRISFKGFEADASLLDKVFNIIEDDLNSDTILTFTGSVPVGISMNAINSFLKTVSQKGSKIVIDSKSFKTLDEIAELKPWLIKPNGEEISEYLRKNIKSYDEILEVAKDLNRRGVENVMVSLGEKGAMLVTKNQAYMCIPPKIKAKSTIGAGDSSIAGFISAIIDNKSVEEALKISVAYGTASCLREGTLPPLAEDIESILKDVIKKRL